MAPRQLRNSLLRNWTALPGAGDRCHVLDVAWRKAFHLRELGVQVRGQTLDHPAPPARPFLLQPDALTDRPIQLDELGINSPKGLVLAALTVAFRSSKEVRVAIGHVQIARAGHHSPRMRATDRHLGLNCPDAVWTIEPTGYQQAVLLIYGRLFRLMVITRAS